MVDIKTPAYPGSTGETLSDGFVVQMQTRDDVGRVLTLGLTRFGPSDLRFLPGEGDGAMRLRVFTAALLRWDLPASLDDAVLEASLVSEAMAYAETEGSDDEMLRPLLLALAALRPSLPETLPSRGNPALELSLLLPLPGGVREAYWRWASPRALLILRPGSIDLGLLWGTALRAKSWAIGVYARLGPGAAASKREFVDDLRGSIAGGRQLPRLDELSPDETAEFATKQLLVVLVHGLFGTDRGTFDNVIGHLEELGPWPIYQALRGAADDPNTPEEQLEQLEVVLPALQDQLRPLLGNDHAMQVLRADGHPFVQHRRELARCAISFVGFPHFTLDTVSSNGGELYDLLAKKFGPRGPKLALLCHSRGGLVARWAAALVRGAHVEVPIEDIITFGTPHDGAELADLIGNDVDFASYILALQAGRTTASLLQVMSYLQANKAVGFLDLRPGGGVRRGEEQEPFIDRLYAAERASGRPFLTAVGGELDTELRNQWWRRPAAALVRHRIGQGRHDMLVSLASSLSQRLGPEVAVRVYRDHFSYFKSGAEVNDLTLDIVAARLWSRVDLVRAFDTWRGGGGAAPAAPRPNRRERFGAPLVEPRRPHARPDEDEQWQPSLD